MKLIGPLVTALATVALVATAGAQQQQRRPAETAAPDCADKGPLPATWSGQAFVIDGDTLAGVGLKPHLRIWGIQAPELRDKATGQETAAGMRARAALVDLLAPADHKVKCRATKFDRYCRIVAQCSVDDAGGVDLGGALIAGGMAYGFYLEELLPWEPRASGRYSTAEAEARKQRRGLWKDWLGD